MESNELSTHYTDYLLRETERRCASKGIPKVRLERDSLSFLEDIEGNLYLHSLVRVQGRLLTIAHHINHKWSIDRNAWEMGQKIATKIVKNKVL